jgi:CDP-diacylglycerol--glycerol-3-phosphate 3-phosphatidyltransferase
MTAANWITISRLAALPWLLYLLDDPTPERRWWCLLIFLVAALTDWLDGYVARRFDQVTELGKFLDPLVDKLLVLTPLLSLVRLGAVPVVGVFLILARELAIAGWRVNQATVAGANLWGKLKTVSQIIAVGLLLAPITSEVSLGAFWLAVSMTLISGGIYLGSGFTANKSAP